MPLKYDKEQAEAENDFHACCMVNSWMVELMLLLMHLVVSKASGQLKQQVSCCLVLAGWRTARWPVTAGGK